MAQYLVPVSEGQQRCTIYAKKNLKMYRKKITLKGVYHEIFRVLF
jgi:hypothetical protein